MDTSVEPLLKSVEESKLFENMEPLSPCFNKEKHLEEICFVTKEIPSHDKTPDTCILVDNEKAECSVKSAGSRIGRKIGILASTLRTTNLITEIGTDPLLPSSGTLSVQSVPESKLESMENNFGIVKKMYGSGYSSKSDLDTAVVSSSTKETKLYERFDAEKLSDFTAIEEESLSRMKWKSQCDEGESGSVTARGTEIVSGNIEIPLVSEHYGFCNTESKFNGFKTASEKHIKISAENLSKGKLLFKEIENMILEVINTQDTTIEHIPAQNRDTIQETESTNSSDETENKINFKVPVGVIHKSLPHVIINTQTNNTSAVISEPKLFGQDACLTASQTADVAELFSMLEDTGSQTEFTQFRKKSPIDCTIKDDKLLVEASAPSLTPIWSEWKDVDFDENFEIESSLPLNSKPCISQQRAGNRVLTEISKCLKVIKNRSESNQQIAEKIKQIKSNDCGDSFDSSNKTKPCTASLIPNSCMSDLEIDSNTDKKELVTKLNLAVLPPKMNAACTNIHGGFCTANGSKIKLSSESLKKSADIFREIDHDQGQTSSETISNRHLGYLHDSSTMENEKVAEDKLGDVTKILTSKTYHECAAIHLPVNNTNIPSPILRNRLQIESKSVGNNRQKSAIQIESKLVTVSKEILDRAKSLIAEENLLHESENKKSGSPCSMKESTCMPQNTLSVCSGTKNTVNKELVRNEVESTGGNLCSTSVVNINPAFEIEDANGIECFWETSSKRFRDSVEYLDKAKLFDNEECCGNLPNTKTISEQVHVDEFQKILVNCQSAVKNVGSNVEFYEQPGNVKAALNVPICAVSATASMNSISVDSGIFIKESQVSGKKELPSPVEQVHLPDVTDTEMRGFQTASGKIVSICRASLTKAKTFFAEEDLPMNAPETFSTAVPAPHVDAQFIDNTVKNTATEQEPDKSKISGSLSSCIKQDDFAITGKVCEDPTAEPRFQVLTGYPIGFSTASGKSLQVSEELLRKCKQLFSEIEGNKDDFEKILEKDLKPELAKTKSSGENFSLDTNVSFGFNTASGKKVIVSNGAQQKAKSMLKEFDDMNDGPLGSLEYPKGKIYEKTQELVSPEAALYMSGCQACRSSTGPIQQCTSKNCSDRVSAVCDDFHGEANGSIINNAELNTGPSKPLSASELNSKICMLGFETAKRKEVIVEESNISVARSFLASKEERTADLTTGEKDGVASGGSSNCDKVSVSVEGCYVLKNDLDAHSTMLENYIENEALESAKALLDDGLFGSTTDQEVPSDLKSMNQSIDKSEFKLGKRLRSEEKLEKEGPPPKRKLLADFDRSMQNDYKSAFRSSTGNLEVATGESTSVDSGAMMKVRQVFDNEELLSANCYPIQQEPQLDDSVTGMKGFQTASGKIVSVCKVSLAKAKAFFAEADLSMNVPETFSTTVPPPYIGTQFIDDTIKNTTTDQNNEPDKSKISGSFSNHLNLTKQDDFAITSKVWEGTASEPPCQALTEHIGFSTASGKSVQVSEESLRECKKLFSEIEGNKEDFQRTLEKDSVPEQTKRKTLGQTYHSDTASTNISFGFNTASGKRVPVSNDALQKAKFKLKEFDDMNDGSLGSLEYPEGKIYEKTRALVSESSLSTADDPSLNGHPTCTKRSTSQKSLPKNSSERFSDLPDDFQEEANGSKINDVEVNPGLSKPLPANGLNSKICMFGFQTAHGKDVLVEESNLAAARSFLASEKESTAGENVGVAGDRSSNCNADSVSVLRSHALKNDLDAHSKILENYIENEMLESAKALLEDDPFDSTSDYGVQSNVESMNQSDRSKLRMGKRLRSEEKLAKEGLPPKRQLLAYFDRTIQNVHKPRFKSSITNPEGIFCDRRKFTYNVPLKPLICDPSKGNSTSSLIHQQLISPNVTFPIQENQNKNDLWFHHKTKSLNGQDPVFVASFQKHSVGCVQPYNSKQRTSKSTKMFVPPFKTGSNAPQTEQFENTNITLSKKSENEIIMKNNFDQSKHSHEGSALKNDRLENKPKPISNNSEHHGIIVEGSVQMVHNLQCARDLQEMRLIKKRRQTIRPEPGSLYRTKHSGAARKSLHTAVEGMFPVSRRGGKLYVYGISRSTLSLQGANAESFCINCREFFSEELMMAGNGIQLADGEWLIPDHSGMAGKSAFHRALLDTPGVDPKLITEAWTYNHYKWIVWKLAAMETAFPKQFGSRCLTPEMLLLQLKYRYDVEIDKSRRSALRKIMERDDTSTKTLILCVSKIISMGIKCLQNGHNASDDTVKQSKEENEKSVLEANDLPVGVIEVTDGWYGIKVILDRPLTALLQKKRLAVGQKIVVHGAELIGSQDAYTPLEAPESLMMKISANSTRRARWYAKLGFHYDPRPFPLPLSSLFGEGGMVGCVDVIIQRTYPIQWMEKKCNGVCVFRNERAEEREAQIHCEKEQRKLEALCAKIEADLQEKYKMERKLKREHRMQRLNKQQIMKLQEGVELYEAIQNSLDPSSLEMCLNEQQLRTLNNYRQLLNEQKQSQIEVEFRKALESAQSDSGYPKRDVSPVWKLRIVDYKGQDNNAVYMLSIWRPVAELQSLLKEGKRYRIYHLNTSCCKSRFGGVDLQLTATKKTRYQQFQPSPEVLEKLYHPRQAVVYNMLYNPSFRTFCKEIDLVGYVIYITEKAGFAPMVYLANENQDLVVVKFWASLNQLVLEDTVKLGALIIASNLQWSSDSYMNVPKLFAGELSSFSANPKEALLRETYNELKSSVQFPKIFLKDAEEKVMALLKTINTPTSLRSSRDFGIDLRTPHTPIQRTPKFIPAKSSTELSLLDAESSPQTPLAAMDSGCKSMLGITKMVPTDSLSNLKKKGLSFLSRVPSPPRLSPLYNSVPQSVQKGFRPPRICITPQSSTKVKSKESSNVQTPSLSRAAISKMTEVNWIPDEELAMINTQDLCDNLVDNEINRQKIKREQTVNCKVPAVLLQNVKNDFHSDIELQNSSAAIESTNHLVASQSKRKCTEGTITLNTCEGVYQSEENVITQNHEYGGDEVQHQPGKLLLCRKKPQQRWKRKRY
uniref:Tower domain-containing protein n=1 Tax=Callorhinchus milii TaxID=7868 RepID=A0A4W3K4V5_CALMI